MSGAKIIDALKEAAAGDIARVTIEGETWARVKDIHADQQEIMRINNALRETLLEARGVIANYWPMCGPDEEPEKGAIAILNKIDAIVR